MEALKLPFRRLVGKCLVPIGAFRREEVMPRYFFHLQQSDNRFDDSEGQILRDADEAWATAKATARALIAGDPARQNVWITSSFEVTDEAGEIILEFPFVEAIDVSAELN